MSQDIIARLREEANTVADHWKRGGAVIGDDALLTEAAAEIERLRLEIDSLDEVIKRTDARMVAEIERLRGERDNWLGYAVEMHRFAVEDEARIELAERTLAEREAEIERLRNPWQDISTAPRDGTRVLGCNDRRVFEVFEMRWEPSYGWGDPGWDGQYEPTHWMPLPPPPEDQKT